VPARLRHLCALPLLALALVISSVLLGPVSSASAVTVSAVSRATNIALGQVGDPYRYGAAGPSAFDCSGLIYYSFRKAGIRNIPRTSGAQAARARHIKKSSLRRGDLMFFTSGGRVYHAAIFLGWDHGRAIMLHSPRPGERVKRQAAWTSSWFAATLRG
jgi:cell wall-associated NlpC family hydrolase